MSRKVLSQSADGLFEIVILTNDILEDALNVIREVFCKNESFCAGSDVAKDLVAVEDLVKLCRTAAADGVSTGAVEKSTGVVAAVTFNKIQRKLPPGKSFFEEFMKTCKSPSSAAFMKFTIDVDSRIDLFERYDTDCLFEIMCMATRKEFQNKGLALALCREDLKLAGSDQVPTEAVGVMYTSKIAQKVGKRLELDQLFEVPFDEFNFNGETLTKRLDYKQTSVLLMGKKVK